jgi:hypothetical protein
VHLRVGVQLPHQFIDLALARGLGEVVAVGLEADLGAGLALVAHVHLRGRIVADQHRRQAGARLASGNALLNFRRHLRSHFGSNRVSVNDACRHLVSPNRVVGCGI